jgi:heptosyltransferase-1
MRDILLIKTSSLGDVVHQMPAVTEARRRCPDMRLTWVVEEDYAPLVALHPAVDAVLPVASRRWRIALHRAATWHEIGAFRRALRARRNDIVLDTQGLFRTGLMARVAPGQRHGFDAASAREAWAAAFYDVRHHIDGALHAVARNRLLTARALGYVPQGDEDFGLDRARLMRPAAGRTAVLLHATARAEKEWPRDRWIALARALHARGYEPVAPWGTAAERVRSEQIAAATQARVPERQRLDEVARILADAALVVGVDTGLLHVAAALGVPLVAIFVGSDPGLTGPRGAGPIALVGHRGALPAIEDVLAAADQVMRSPPPLQRGSP